MECGFQTVTLHVIGEVFDRGKVAVGADGVESDKAFEDFVEIVFFHGRASDA
jgi:hypothetical protein